MIIDTHSHIHFEKEFRDLDLVMARALESGVIRQIIVGCNLEDSLKAMNFCQGRAGFDYTVGIHPNASLDCDIEYEIFKLRQILEKKGEFVDLEKSPVAIGEIGLDYFRNFSQVFRQKEVFSQQLDLAREFGLPVVIHCRDAFSDLFEILSEFVGVKVLLHCFTGSKEEAKIAIERGYLISFSGVLTYPKNRELREIAGWVPSDKFVVETDCPYLPPQSRRGKRNEPAFIVETLKVIAECRRIDLKAVEENSFVNAVRFFGLE